MTFDEWLNEMENFASRHERLCEDFMEVKDLKKLRIWLESAYEVGYHGGYATGYDDAKYTWGDLDE